MDAHQARPKPAAAGGGGGGGGEGSGGPRMGISYQGRQSHLWGLTPLQLKCVIGGNLLRRQVSRLRST